MISKAVFSILISSVFLGSCASYKAKYANEDYQKYNQEESKVLHSLYLVGDGGGVEMNESTGLLRYLKTELDGKTEATILFLGDNLYPVGVPPKGTKNYDLSIYRLQVQLDVLENFPGRIVFIPGNHDWYKYGPEGLLRQEQYIDSVLNSRPNMEYKNQENYFLPESGCSGPVVIELLPQVQTVIFDSHWFLESVEKNNFDHCPYQTRKQFIKALDEKLLELSNETIVFALHHPPFSYGEHGGFYHWLTYVFPLTQIQKSLLIPLPVSGFIYSTMRPYINVQDNKHRINKLLVREMMETIRPYAPSLVVSGHEHNLQFIQEENHYFVVSGSASANTACSLEGNAQFCVGEQGYVRIDFQTSKLAIANYYVIKDDLPELLYQKKLTFN